MSSRILFSAKSNQPDTLISDLAAAGIKFGVLMGCPPPNPEDPPPMFTPPKFVSDESAHLVGWIEPVSTPDGSPTVDVVINVPDFEQVKDTLLAKGWTVLFADAGYGRLMNPDGLKFYFAQFPPPAFAQPPSP